MYGVKLAFHPIIIYFQYMATRKQIILIVVALLIVSGGLSALFLYQKSYNPRGEFPTPAPTMPQEKITNSISAQWITYHNPTYHYRIDYPSHFEFGSGFPKSDDGIGFAEPEGPWQISVHIMQTSFYTPEEWLKEMDKESRRYDQYREEKDKNKPPSVIEREIVISGMYRAIIRGYPQSRDDSLKSALFIKDGMLFDISVRNPDIDHERVWNSFRFE